jgi:hypothetical protein
MILSPLFLLALPAVPIVILYFVGRILFAGISEISKKAIKGIKSFFSSNAREKYKKKKDIKIEIKRNMNWISSKPIFNDKQYLFLGSSPADKDKILKVFKLDKQQKLVQAGFLVNPIIYNNTKYGINTKKNGELIRQSREVIISLVNQLNNSTIANKNKILEKITLKITNKQWEDMIQYNPYILKDFKPTKYLLFFIYKTPTKIIKKDGTAITKYVYSYNDARYSEFFMSIHSYEGRQLNWFKGTDLSGGSKKKKTRRFKMIKKRKTKKF